MREELKRCNYIGTPQSLYEFACIAIAEHTTDVTTVKSINALNNRSNVKVLPCIALFEELQLLSVVDKTITASKEGLDIVVLGQAAFLNLLTQKIFTYLIDSGYLNTQAISYKPNKSVSTIKKSGFPLSVAVFRNLLLDIGALKDLGSDIYEIESTYEDFFEKKVAQKHVSITLEQLKKKLERQEHQGRLAEEYVVKYEQKRLLWGKNSVKVKQISDIDVTAGYDIVSFQDNESTCIDRFIEVKSYYKTPSFFWSGNEIDTAKRLGSSYYLYLIDFEKYLLDDYEPFIICNPATVIIQSENWLIEANSIKVTQV